MTTSVREELGTVETLTRARDLLQAEGWTQREYVRRQPDGTCKRCAYGALEGWHEDEPEDPDYYDRGRVTTAVRADEHAVHLLRLAMYEIHTPKQTLFSAGGVASWNDADGRTKEQVLAAFDKAIEMVREELE